MSPTVGRLRYEHAPVTSHDEQVESGRGIRDELPRSAHAVYRADADRDPLGILQRQHEARVPELVPLRIERMLSSPFAFYRGTAAIQAADLAREATTGIRVVICGDAHLSNFGIYSSSQRSLVFDLNDFDESTVGPWEWDVKRLITSVVIAARERGSKEAAVRKAALHAAYAYRAGLRRILEMNVIERYYVRVDVTAASEGLKPESRSVVEDAIKAARKRTSERVFQKITERAPDGSIRIVEQPPTLTHVEPEIEERIHNDFNAYLTTVPPDVALLLSQYTPTDVVRRVVGVGSVGTRCFILVLTGPRGEPLILQVKQASRSVIDEFGGVRLDAPPAGFPDPTTLHGFRVTSSQRILQATSDPFLGHLSARGNQYYVRQFRDGNVSIETSELSEQTFDGYAQACALLLARAHAQSPDAARIGGYLGSSDAFDRAVVDWSLAYADQSLSDYRQLQAAVAAGRF